ncbi:MAG: mechanosensitive ion channel family protein, partial [Bdellovibrionales bacterium]|nr:mechanosensitive ion channel family protein [Bdellovibrionales bacterium]
MEYLDIIESFWKTPKGWSWLAIICVTVIATVIFKIVFNFAIKMISKLTKKTSNKWDDIFVEILSGMKWPIILILIFHFVSRTRELSETSLKVITNISIIAATIQIGLWGFFIIKKWRNVVLETKLKNDPSAASAMGLMYASLQTLFIVTITLIGLSNVGVNVGALLAGLGVGGIAVALAAQNVLGDLLASLSIVLDKPFVVGDFIIVGEEAGTVEMIGIKTTRIRRLSGEELVISNKDLLESRIRNYKRMWERRVVQKFGVVYSTSTEKLQVIPQWVQEIVETESKVRFDRCHFCQYGNSSLDFELVFWVSNPDYNVFMDIQQRILLAIF